ncbi:MAG: FG-GAP repeat domain-containing protein [Pyrinomonadaceae bacterium]
MFSSKFSITATSIMLFISLNLSSAALAQTPPTQTNLGYNETLNSQFIVWDASLRAVGFYIKPSISFNLTGVQTNFNPVQQSGSQDRDVTIELYTDRPAVGGTLLRTATFNSSSARGRLGAVTFAPLVLSAGTRYFVGFRNIAGIGINTTNDAGAVNCGACLYVENQTSPLNSYNIRGGTDVPSAQDQPIIRLVGTAVGNGNGSSRSYDFDGDGRSDFAVFRPSNGTWYLQNSTSGFNGIQFGASGDIPAAGDFDGDGKTAICVFRPSNGAWYRLNSSNGQFVGVTFGQTGDQPSPTDFDGDGKSDIAVFRPSNGTWYYLRSSDGSFGATAFGANGDIPISGIR